MSSEVLKTELVQVGQDSLQAVRKSGHGWVLVKAACEALGLDQSAQRKKLQEAPWAVGAMIASTGSDGKTREMFCLRSDKVAMWLATIDTSRLANDEARAKLVMWQCEAAEVLDRWVRGDVAEHTTPAALPAGWDLRKLADIADKMTELRALLSDFQPQTVRTATEIAKLADMSRATFYRCLSKYPELRANKRGGAWLVHRTLADLEERGEIRLFDREHITKPELDLAIAHRNADELADDEVDDVGSDALWQVCKCHRLDVVDKGILAAITSYKGQVGQPALMRALGYAAKSSVKLRMRSLQDGGYLTCSDNGIGRTKVWAVNLRKLLGHTEGCAVLAEHKPTPKQQSLLTR